MGVLLLLPKQTAIWPVEVIQPRCAAQETGCHCILFELRKPTRRHLFRKLAYLQTGYTKDVSRTTFLQRKMQTRLYRRSPTRSGITLPTRQLRALNSVNCLVTTPLDWSTVPSATAVTSRIFMLPQLRACQQIQAPSSITLEVPSHKLLMIHSAILSVLVMVNTSVGRETC